MSGDIDDEYKKSVRDFDRYQKKQTAGRKNSFLTDIKYKSLESILGGQKVRNMLSSINFKWCSCNIFTERCLYLWLLHSSLGTNVVHITIYNIYAVDNCKYPSIYVHGRVPAAMFSGAPAHRESSQVAL